MTDNSYKEDNKESLEFIKKIDSYIIGMGKYFVVPFINMHTMFIKCVKGRPNNVLLVAPRGSGKSTFFDVLVNSNPKLFRRLPKKMFESELVQKGREYFNDKILIHDDLITAFGGLTTKQRQQLASFWTQLLSEGEYTRERHGVTKVRCCCLFGIASDIMPKYRENLLEETFLDRFAQTTIKISDEKKAKIMRFLDEKEQKMPKICIKSAKKRKKIGVFSAKINPKILEKRRKLALDLDICNIISFERARQYIDNFMMANAYYNGRDKVTENDFKFYKETAHVAHILTAYSVTSNEKKVKVSLTDNPDLSPKERAKNLEIPVRTMYRILRKLRK